MATIRAICVTGIASVWLGLSGCVSDKPLNPSFPLTQAKAEAAIEEMEQRPIGLVRPVVILGGYFDPGFGTVEIEKAIRRISGDDRVIAVSFFARFNFEACREHAIESIEAAFPSSDPDWTMEVDVIAGSMGGIVARYAALPVEESELVSDPAAARTSYLSHADRPPPDEHGPPPRKRLKIARLFTISTPHRGANLAMLPTFDSLVLAQRPGSELLAELDAHLTAARYRIIPYVRLGDQVVGCANAAPPGRTAWWVPNAPLQFSHVNSMRDERIIADIARRLRGEPPFASEPPAPLPED